MQARKPMRAVLSAKSVACAVSPQRSAHRVRCDAPNSKRESASRCSRFPRSSKRLLTGLFRKAQPSELWDLEDHLTRRRKEINYKYDSRGSRLTHVLGKLLSGSRLEEERLRGLSQHQLNAIHSYKDFLSETDGTEPGNLSAMPCSRQLPSCTIEWWLFL
jgi:hypothetical protein